jgi:hypothetical protein
MSIIKAVDCNTYISLECRLPTVRKASPVRRLLTAQHLFIGRIPATKQINISIRRLAHVYFSPLSIMMDFVDNRLMYYISI